MLLDDKQKELTLVKNIINTSILLSKQLKLYGVANKSTELAANRLLGFFESYFLYHKTLRLIVTRHRFLYNEDFVDRDNSSFVNFAYTLFQHGISSIEFHQDIPASHIQTFLSVISRPPAETWEEGGIVAALNAREVNKISVREMSEEDLEFVSELEEEDRSVLLKEKSPLWDRFALAIYKGFTRKSQDDKSSQEVTNPVSLAEMTNQILEKMSLANQQAFSKGLSSFLASLQFEKISRYRKRALAKLTEFISQVSPEIRHRLFNNIFALKMKPSFSEEFFAGLSDEVIVELLELSAQDHEYTPPVILKVLGKIAQDRKIDLKNAGNIDSALVAKKHEVAKLFKKDDFDKYVPEKYRDALLNIIQHDEIPNHSSTELLELKKTLENTHQEKHTADIIIKILNANPDKKHLAGLSENLLNIVDLYLRQGAYQDLYDLCQLINNQSTDSDAFERFQKIVATQNFSEQLLAGVNKYGRSRYEDIEKVILAVGPSFAPALLEAVATDLSRANRLFYLNVLQQLDPKTVIKHATPNLNDSRWFFVRNIIYVLRSIKDKEAVPYIMPLSQHPHPKVRNEAIKACLYYGCDDAVTKLLQMLDDKDPDTVNNAITLASMVKDKHVAGKLVVMLKDNPVIGYRLGHKKNIVKTLAKVSPKGALPYFFELLSWKNTLHPRQHKELTNEIVKVFKRYDPEILRPALEQNLPNVNHDLQERLQTIQNELRG